MRFSLLQLLLFVAVVALSLATFGPWGIALTLLFLVPMLWFRSSAAERVTAIIFWGLVLVFTLCVVPVDVRPGHRLSCDSNRRDIGRALHEYHDEHGRFPPQYVADAEGRPMHSWRVLILPYLSHPDASRVYEQYRFDEPWNGPHNRQLAAQLRECFLCPTTDAVEAGSPLVTHYVAVTGPDTAWPGPMGTCLEDITDGDGDTIILVEIADSDIQWMEPRDITLEEALSDRDGSTAVPSSHHCVRRAYFFLRTCPLAGNVLMVDGHWHCLGRRPSRNDLAALLSIAGGEPIDADALFKSYRRTFFQRLDLKRCLSFALFLAFFAILVGGQRPKQKAGQRPNSLTA